MFNLFKPKETPSTTGAATPPATGAATPPPPPPATGAATPPPPPPANDEKEKEKLLGASLEKIEVDGEKKEELVEATLEKDNSWLKTAVTMATDLDIVLITSVLISGTEIAISVGATLPVIGIAFDLISRLKTQYDAYNELDEILETVSESIKNCAMMISLAKKTTEILKKLLIEYFKDNTNVGEFKETVLNLQKYKMNSSIETKIETSLKKIIDILNKFDKSEKEKSRFAKFKTFVSQALQGNMYISSLKDEIAMLVLHMNSYNMQFVWVLFLNEHHLQKIFKPAAENDTKKNSLSDELWKQIEDSDEFKNYLVNDISPEEIKTLAKPVTKGGRRKHRKTYGKKTKNPRPMNSRKNVKKMSKSRKIALRAAYMELKKKVNKIKNQVSKFKK